MEYRWNCGSGITIARISQVRVDDGIWHQLKVSRRGRHARIELDDLFKAEATGPAGSDVINLFRHASMYFFYLTHTLQLKLWLFVKFFLKNWRYI